ncbi:MAG: hypothetical protein ACK5NG_02385, partial [Chthoniobacterales bacterium]
MKHTAPFFLLLTVLSCLSMLTPDTRAESETLLFKDEFDTSALFIEHFKPTTASQWKVEDGELVAATGGTANVNVTLESAAKVVVDVAMIPDTLGKGGFAGINVGGCLFALRSDGVWCVYREKGKKRSLGNFEKKEIVPGKFYRFEITRRPMGGGYMYSYTVDGEAMPDFTFLNPEDDVDVD